MLSYDNTTPVANASSRIVFESTFNTVPAAIAEKAIVSIAEKDVIGDFGTALAFSMAAWAACYIVTNEMFPALNRVSAQDLKKPSWVPRRWISPKATDEYASRVMSLLHAAAATVLCGILAVQYWFAGEDLSTHAMTSVDAQVISVSVGYFLVDTVGIWRGSYFDPTFLAHHFGASWVLLDVVLTRNLGYHSVALLGVMECANPFLHVRWLRHADGHATDALSWLFVASFAFGRLLAGPFLWVVCYYVPHYAVFNRFIGVVMFVVSAGTLANVAKKQSRGEKWEC